MGSLWRFKAIEAGDFVPTSGSVRFWRRSRGPGGPVQEPRLEEPMALRGFEIGGNCPQ